MSNLISRFIAGRKVELFFLSIVLVFAGIAHSYNMFNYPYYENDEGTYMSQAWAIINLDKLAPYTYWYDHAPFGWIQIAIWTILSGGFFTFGFSVNSGRVLMLIFHLFSTILLYNISKKIIRNKVISFLTISLFSFSPLGIYFQRRVLLDNIMIFWLLLTVNILLAYKNRLSRIALASLTLGLAILTKETAVFFIPILTYYVYSISHKSHRSYAISQWLLIQLLVISLYFSYALIKNEFFPTGSFLGGQSEHVSLLDSLFFQSSRQGGGTLLNVEDSYFWKSFNKVWSVEDPLLIYFGLFCTLILTVVSIFNLQARLLAFLSLSYLVYLIRGGIVIEFYILPLIPLLALNIGYLFSMTLASVNELFKHSLISKATYLLPILFALLYYNQFIQLTPKVRGGVNMWTAQQTKSQLQAIDWIRRYRSTEELIIVDSYGFIELRDPKFKNFPNAEWYSKVDTDKEVREDKLRMDYRNIDYLAVTPQMEYDVRDKGLTIVNSALKNSRQIINFDHDYWRVRIFGNLTPRRIARASYQNDILKYLQNATIISRLEPDSVFLKNQSAMLLRAVFENDKKTFDTILDWINSHLLLENQLYATQWRGQSINNFEAETSTNSELAYALILASSQWDTPRFLDHARGIIRALRKNNTITFQGKTYLKRTDALLSGTDQLNLYLPSYNTSVYNLFSQIDDRKFWDDIKNTAYQLINDCTFNTPQNQLPPSTCTINKSLNQSSSITTNNTFWFENYRFLLNIVLDHLLNDEPRAFNYISNIKVFQQEWLQRYRLGAIYNQNGQVIEDYETVRLYAPAVAVLTIQNTSLAKEMWDLKIRDRFYEDETTAYWEDPKNIDNQILPYLATKIMQWSK